MTVSIFRLVEPPYEGFLYVSYGVTLGGEVMAYVWPAEGAYGKTIKACTYPPGDHDRALKEIKELSDLIVSTRTLLGLHTPVREAQLL